MVDNAFVWGENDKNMIQSDLLSKIAMHVVGGIDFTMERDVPSQEEQNKSFNILFAATRDDLDAIDQLIGAAKNVGVIK